MGESDDLVLIFIPSLVSVILHHEKKKGSPLTEEEVIAIRDRSVTIALPREEAAKMAESRGYDDIDPETCWEVWQKLRTQFPELPAGADSR